MTGAIDLNGHSTYFHWGVVQISLANLLVIVVMLAVFAVAVVFPLSRHGRQEQPEPLSTDAVTTSGDPDGHH